MTLKGFFAYPSKNSDVVEAAREAISSLKLVPDKIKVDSWEEADIAGRFIIEPILDSISNADFFAADITFLNFNVSFEIGFAIGKGKRILLTRNSALKGDSELIKETGIFDTLGYKTYSNSRDLSTVLESANISNPIRLDAKSKKKEPVYLVLPKSQTDIEIRLLSRVKKAKLQFRSFDPQDKVRLAGFEAIDSVSSSLGVLLITVPTTRIDAQVHNLRTAFVAGLARGMGKELLILQAGSDPIPLDYRDFVASFQKLTEIDEYIADFATQITDLLQGTVNEPASQSKSVLAGINIGASSAENEFRDLGSYYLETDEYQRVVRGEVQIVAARKGAGKTALFLRVRDKIRGHRQNLVLDLRPEGFQLLKFKELVLDLLEEGTKEHTLTAFWEYLLLLELCHKALAEDRIIHTRNHTLREGYLKLKETYEQDSFVAEGDFSERMVKLTHRIEQDFKESEFYGHVQKARLTSQQITEVIYKHDINELRTSVSAYLQHKEEVWILFDNLDKGWPAHGLTEADLVTLKCLIEAVGKVQKNLRKEGIRCFGIIFVRNDVYELLIDQTSDRGKLTRVSLDWSDPDLLREVLRRRFVFNGFESSKSFSDIWLSICVSLVKGEESSQYLIDRCLMRPRALLELFQYCRSHAVNLGHDRIELDDILQGESGYSTDLVTTVGLEMRDVLPQCEDILYEFIGLNAYISKPGLLNILTKKLGTENVKKALNLLLWFGVVGILREGEEECYIYSVKYDMKRLHALIARADENTIFCINPAFWLGLEIVN